MKAFDVVSVETSAPIIQKLADRDKWAYRAEWICMIVLKGEGVVRFSVKPGYWTDLASVPKALRGVFDNGSGVFGVLIASQCHDVLYSTHYMSKEFADFLFFAILRHYGVGVIKARLYWAAVRLFGGNAWKTLSDAQMAEDRTLCSFQWLSRI